MSVYKKKRHLLLFWFTFNVNWKPMNGSIIKYLLIFFFLMLLLLLCSILPSFNTVIGDLIATAATTLFYMYMDEVNNKNNNNKTYNNHGKLCYKYFIFFFFLFLIIFLFLSLVQFYCYYASLEVNNGLNKKKRICTILYTCFFHIHLKAIELCDIIFMSNCFL